MYDPSRLVFLSVGAHMANPKSKPHLSPLTLSTLSIPFWIGVLSGCRMCWGSAAWGLINCRISHEQSKAPLENDATSGGEFWP